MTRIIAGRARGRRLRVPSVADLRPTTDRVREAMFSTLSARLCDWEGMRVLDLYSGTGALGLEALSRGAVHVTMIEQDRAALRALQRNIAAVAIDGVDVRRGDVATVLRRSPTQAYDLVLADPPYRFSTPEVVAVLASLVRERWLVPGALLVVERDARAESLRWPRGLEAQTERRYADTVLWYGRATLSSERTLSGGSDVAENSQAGDSHRHDDDATTDQPDEGGHDEEGEHR